MQIWDLLFSVSVDLHAPVSLSNHMSAVCAGAQDESAAASHSPLANSAAPSAQSDHLPAQQVRQSGYPGSESDNSAAESDNSAAEYSLSVSHQSAHKDTAVQHHVPAFAAAAKLAVSEASLPQSGHQTQLLTDPLEMQISEGASLLSSVSPGMQPSSQSPRDPSLLQLSDNDQTPSAVTPDVSTPLPCGMQCTAPVTGGRVVGRNGGSTNAADGEFSSVMIAAGIAAATKHPNNGTPASAGMSCNKQGCRSSSSSSRGINTSQKPTVSKPLMSSYEPKHPQANSTIQMNSIGSASQFPHMLRGAYADASTQLQCNAADVTRLPFAVVQNPPATASLIALARAGDEFLGQAAKSSASPPALASDTATRSSPQALKASGSLQPHASMVARSQPDQVVGAINPVACHADQLALNAPAQPLQSGLGWSAQGAIASLQSLRQRAPPLSTVSTRLKPGSDAVTHARAAAAQTNSQSAAAVQAGLERNAVFSVLPETQVDAELQWPNQEDALRSDIMGTAGCRITRCLVQQILQPAPEPTAVPGSSVEKAPANKGSHSISVGKPPKVVGKPPSRLKGQTGTGKARSAANLAAVGGPSASAVGIPLSSQGRSAQQPMTTAKASAISHPQQSIPAALVKASKAKMIKQESAAAAANRTFPTAPTTFKQPKTCSVSELIQMTPPTAKAIAATAPAVASTSPAAAAAAAAKDTSAAVKSVSVAMRDALPAVADAAKPSKKADKLGKASDAAEGPDWAGISTKTINNSRAPKAEMTSNSSRPTGVQSLDDSASDAGDTQTGGSAAKPTTSCLKRQSVSSVRSDAPKKARVSCYP